MNDTIGKAGEAEVLALIRRWIGRPRPGSRIIRGIGDDCATIRTGPRTLLTNDAFVEGVHFRRAWTSPWRAGWKALAVNVSDIAAAGGRPTAAAVSLELPPSLPVSWLRGFYEGLLACGRRFGVAVAGGNLSRGLRVACHVTLAGEAPARAIGRDGMKPGDLLACTGSFGASAAGLLALERRLPASGAVRDAVWRHQVPEPRLEAGRALGRIASAMIDVSDGLAHEASILAAESRVAVALVPGAVPVHPAARAIAEARGLDPIRMALESGEEYELLVAVPRPKWRAASRAAARAGISLTAIGEAGRAGKGGARRPDRRSSRRRFPLVRLAGWHGPIRGFDHFGRP